MKDAVRFFRPCAAALLAALLLLLLLLLAPQRAWAQAAEYNKAVGLINSGQNYDEACELLTAIMKSRGDYQGRTQFYMDSACPQAERLRQTEAKLFKDAQALLGAGKHDEALKAFDRILTQIKLKNHPYATQIADGRKKAADAGAAASNEGQAQQAAAAALAAAKTALATANTHLEAGRFAAARNAAQPIADGSTPLAADARTLLGQISRKESDQAAEAKKQEAAAENNKYAQATQDLQQKRFAQARTLAQELVAARGTRVADAQRLLGEIRAAEDAADREAKETAAFNAAMNDFRANRFAEARSGFQAVAAMNGARRGDAQNYVAQAQKKQDEIEQKMTAAQKEQTKFDAAEGMFKKQSWTVARGLYNEVVQLKGDHLQAANNRLREIKDLEAKAAADARAAVDAKPPSPPASSGNDQLLRDGLKAYFEGRLDNADKSLTDYLKQESRRTPLALFFRGATYATFYFLSDETDKARRQMALADFQALRRRYGAFIPPADRYVAPKIRALYEQASK